MVFLDTHYWTSEMPVFPMLEKLSEQGKYRNLILEIADEESEIIESIKRFTQK
jgi:hypothetical protein